MSDDKIQDAAALLPCYGHVPVCTHTDSVVACADCIEARKERGRLYCADLDNCAGPGCMDEQGAPDV